VITVDIRLEQGSFVLEVQQRLEARVTVLFGPSGAGKTTILDAIAGLRRPARGSIVMNGRTLFSSAERINVPPHKRHVGYVSQDIALFPHLDVRRNVTYGQRPGQKLSLEAVTLGVPDPRRSISPTIRSSSPSRLILHAARRSAFAVCAVPCRAA